MIFVSLLMILPTILGQDDPTAFDESATCNFPATRPPAFCTHNGSTYLNVDCDGDGTSDYVCKDDKGNFGVIASKNCTFSWPNADPSTCPAAWGCVFPSTRPTGYCSHNGSTYLNVDCDGDNIPDYVCKDDKGHFGVIGSRTCTNTWPNADSTTCPAAYDCVFPPERPQGYCSHNGSTYLNVDCDGDGTPDYVCKDSKGNFGVIGSKTCTNTWPNADNSTCPAAFDCVFPSERPPAYCTHNGSNYSSVDCDGDGILDYVCKDDKGHFGVFGSATCANTWPNADPSTCPAAFGCVFPSTRPAAFCSHADATYSSFDCDGDSIPDYVCEDTDGNFGVLGSSTCANTWPSGDSTSCPAAFGCVFPAERPPAYCTHNGSTYSSVDCDGDGILDYVCKDDKGHFGVFGSKTCANTWPNADPSTCPAAFGCVFPAERPQSFCSHNGSTYLFVDCDGDGKKDYVCKDDKGHFGVIGSKTCSNTWPNADPSTCPAAFGCQFPSSKPDAFCNQTGSQYLHIDCNHDNVLDYVCIGADGQFGVIGSGKCSNTWPNASHSTCPNAFATPTPSPTSHATPHPTPAPGTGGSGGIDTGCAISWKFFKSSCKLGTKYDLNAWVFNANLFKNLNDLPSGVVELREGTQVVSTITVDKWGYGSGKLPSLSKGLHKLRGYYKGDDTHDTATCNGLVLTVWSGTTEPANTSITLKSSLNPAIQGQKITFTAKVSETKLLDEPTGTITFTCGSTSVLKTLTHSQATWEVSTLPVGQLTCSAQYSGDNDFSGVQSSDLIQTITAAPPTKPSTLPKARTTTTLSTSTNSCRKKDSVQFTATVSAVSPNPISGNVKFWEGTTLKYTAAVTPAKNSAKAIWKVTTLAAGKHTIRAEFIENTRFYGSNSTTRTVQVNA